MGSILVMGGTTFVSSSLAKHLINKGYSVDVLTRGIRSIDYTGYHEHIVCDRRSAQSMKASLGGRSYDVVFDISAYTKNDVEILLTSLGKDKIGKYVFCSSGAVYNQSDSLVDETYDTSDNPIWGNYGRDKKEAEEYIKASHAPYFIFRPTYIYGENNSLYREAYFFDSLQEERVIAIPHGNNTKTQFVHIDDLVRTFESVIYSSIKNRIYNLTHPEIINWESYLETCSNIVGKKPVIIKIDVHKTKIEPRTYFPFRDVTYMLDIKQLEESSLHVPIITLEEGLKKAWAWYKNTTNRVNDPKMIQGLQDILKIQNQIGNMR